MTAVTLPQTLHVGAAFDSGAIEILSVPAGDAGPAHLRLAIRKDSTSDPACTFRQWFHFRLQGARGRPCRIDLANAGESTYPRGWTDYRAVASYDRRDWFRVPTRFEQGVLAIEHTPERDSVYYAYFEPYSWERHLDTLGRMDASPFARVTRVCTTPDGRDLDAVTVGEGSRPVWVIARQHPGESMAEWYTEGLLDRLVDAADPVARRLRALATFHVVPDMNPDGAVRGNLRASATGANLNREWMSPSRELSPEVWFVRERILATGADAFLDVHGDEALPYVFVAGSEMLPDFTADRLAAQARFCEAMRRASPDFQTEHGYGAGKYDAQALRLASKFVGHRFGCLSLTLEMPFKDNANDPDPLRGWSGARSRRLGAATLGPLLEHLAGA